MMDSSKDSLDCIVRKPVFLRVGELTSEFKSGCAVIDVLFPGNDTVSIGMLTFRNNYSASLELKVKIKEEDGSEAWKVCLKKLVLMPHPHYEAGSQSYISLTSDMMSCATDNVIMLRLILRQPSPHWATFGIENLKCYMPLSFSLTSTPSLLGIDDSEVPASKAVQQPIYIVLQPVVYYPKSPKGMTRDLYWENKYAQANKDLPKSENVAELMQQMWAMSEEIKAAKNGKPIGRFDIDGSYDINLLSYT